MVDIIIIGSGAAGLSAARALVHSGKSICILEARDRIGGRIHTIIGEGFSVPVEAGAEFIHGELPLTKSLMAEAKVSYRAGEGRTWTVEKGQLSEGELFHDDWDKLIGCLQNLDQDLTIGDFLRKYFKDPKYASLTDAVKRFVQGYDAADVEKASAFALREEWSSENVKGFRPVGGYSQLMDFLLSEIKKYNSVVKLSSVVTIVQWKRDQVEIRTDKGEQFVARKVLITVPIPILKEQAIQFDPPLREHQQALGHLETGGVVKFLVELKRPVWEQNYSLEFRKMPGMNFLFSDAFVPTWWTQSPSEVPLLTGWLAGPITQTVNWDNRTLLGKAFNSLAYLFNCKKEHLEDEVRVAKVINWVANSFSHGAYAYKTLKTSLAVKIFSAPVENTLYFAGEGLYDGPEMGTVEAALASGKEIAEKIVRES